MAITNRNVNNQEKEHSRYQAYILITVVLWCFLCMVFSSPWCLGKNVSLAHVLWLSVRNRQFVNILLEVCLFKRLLHAIIRADKLTARKLMYNNDVQWFIT